MNVIDKPEADSDDFERSLSEVLQTVAMSERRSKLVNGQLQAEALHDKLEALNSQSKRKIEILEKQIADEESAHKAFIEKATTLLEDQYQVRDTTEKAIGS